MNIIICFQKKKLIAHRVWSNLKKGLWIYITNNEIVIAQIITATNKVHIKYTHDNNFLN